MERLPGAGTSVIHVWKGLHEITDNDRTVYKRIFPFVTVEHMPRDKHRSMTSEINRRIEEAMGELLTDKEWLDRYSKYFYIDETGFLLRGIINSQMLFQQFNPSVKTYLRHIQKVNVENAKMGVLYMQEFTEIGRTKAIEKLYDNYYITAEIFLFATPNSTYIVNIQVPSPEPIPRVQQAYFSWVTEWLADFRIVGR